MNRAKIARVWIGSLIPSVLILVAATVSLASICVGADGHVNFELGLWSDCADETALASVAPDDAHPEAAPCCGACLHMGGDDGEWLTTGTSAERKAPASLSTGVQPQSPAKPRGSDLVRGLSPRPPTPLGLASIVIRC